MLCEEWEKHPELEELDQRSTEPIFIKNLENVQGDERDVILFSVGYGPDQNGNVSMNFGPLNREGGWRRLNVAISRARKAMIVYSVLRPEQIDLSRTRSEGVAGLKGFLEFAEKGRLAVIQHDSAAPSADSTVAESIAKAIAEMGYDVKCAIGSSEFKVDIGVIDPENEEEYILGILLDGSAENSTAQDKFVLQPGVLKGLGWNLIRIWTLDWFDDRQRVLCSIKAAIENVPKQEKSVKVRVKPTVFAAATFEKEDISKLAATAREDYITAEIGVIGTSDEYYLPQNKRRIKEIVEKIIAVESPISRKLLMKKVLSAWSITRGGARVESIFTDVMSSVSATATQDEDRVFIWRDGQRPEEYSAYRADSESAKRTADNIPSEEILCAASEVLSEQISLSEPDLIKETAKKFGFARAGGVIESTIGYAVRKGIESGKLAKSDKGRVTAV